VIFCNYLLYALHSGIATVYVTSNKDYFIADLHHIFRYFLYTTVYITKVFLYKETSIQQTELA